MNGLKLKVYIKRQKNIKIQKIKFMRCKIRQPCYQQKLKEEVLKKKLNNNNLINYNNNQNNNKMIQRSQVKLNRKMKL